MAKIGKAINATEQNSEKDQRKVIQKKMTYFILELIKKNCFLKIQLRMKKYITVGENV